mmetsp:Transcript_24645/g.55048  ORF Transcript_24645/g.55048 Transcript_24645/m.55048 type:complete len:224 (+) Transcript_24645:511-1182(+)
MKVSGWTPVVRSEHEQQRLSLRAFRERERSETPSLHRVAEPSLFRRSGVCVPSRTTDPVPIVREGCPVADTTAVSRNAARATPRVRGSGRNRANHRVPEPPRGGPIRASFGARCNHGHDPPGLLPPAQQTKRDGAGAVVPWVVVGSGSGTLVWPPLGFIPRGRKPIHPDFRKRNRGTRFRCRVARCSTICRNAQPTNTRTGKANASYGCARAFASILSRRRNN